jgi:hypothetical protein
VLKITARPSGSCPAGVQQNDLLGSIIMHRYGCDLFKNHTPTT